MKLTIKVVLYYMMVSSGLISFSPLLKYHEPSGRNSKLYNMINKVD